MLGKLAFAGALIAAAALLGAPASVGSRHAEALCFGSPATITGSGTIDGTNGDDVIVGSDAADSIHGKGGNDKLCGGAGDDKLGGGPGDDQLDGGAGNDDLDGGPGNDTLLGAEGDDTIACGTENDVADGGPGTNTAITTGFEACETVTNATAPATEPAPTPHPLKATLTADKTVPRSKSVRGGSGLFSGTLTATEGGASLVWRLSFKKLTGSAVSAHIHEGTPGKAGAVVVTLCAPCSSGAHGTVDVSGQPARRAILSGEAYVDIHTKKNPAGEIRGQIAASK